MVTVENISVEKEQTIYAVINGALDMLSKHVTNGDIDSAGQIMFDYLITCGYTS